MGPEGSSEAVAVVLDAGSIESVGRRMVATEVGSSVGSVGSSQSVAVVPLVKDVGASEAVAIVAVEGEGSVCVPDEGTVDPEFEKVP